MPYNGAKDPQLKFNADSIRRKNSGCCFLVQEAFFMSFLDCQGFLEVRIKLIRSCFSIQVCGSVMKTLMCQQTYVPFSNIKSKVISEIMSSQAKKLNQHSAAAAEGTYKNEDEKEKGLWTAKSGKDPHFLFPNTLSERTQNVKISKHLNVGHIFHHLLLLLPIEPKIPPINCLTC